MASATGSGARAVDDAEWNEPRPNQVFAGKMTTEVCGQIANGFLTDVDCRDFGVDVHQIAEALTTPTCQLRRLIVSRQNFGAYGAKELGAALRTNKSLKELNIDYNNIGAEGGKEIGTALKTNNTLQTLDLSENRIGDEGGKEIGAALKTNHTLRKLNLALNGIGAEGAKEIAAAFQTNNTLKELNLMGNGIGGGKEAVRAAWAGRSTDLLL
eukprot:m.256145 g.256145  ORF g.256145 m.256145 type:complete len:212 (+) comp26570_c0_seq6:592-1227(+)